MWQRSQAEIQAMTVNMKYIEQRTIQLTMRISPGEGIDCLFTGNS